MKRPELFVSMSPHIHAGYTVQRMMIETIIALLPSVLAGWLFFGLPALAIVLFTTLTAVVTEALWQKALGRPVEVMDGAAAVTGILLGLLLSPECPWWLAMLGAIVAILVGKQLFGGIGNHPFNSALVGWSFMFLSYRFIMESYPMPEPLLFFDISGFIEYPPMDTLHFEGLSTVMDIPVMDLLVGNVPGTIGTVSVLAALIGGIYLVARRIIRWEIPVSFIASVWIFAFICHQIDPQLYAGANFHVLAGWVTLGAFFLATEPGTCPVTVPGMLLYGLGCGCLTMIIRTWGSYMDGVAFAILLMNGATPLLDRIRPKVVGRVKQVA